MSSPRARVLLLDIETQPDLVWAWGVYDQNAIAVKEHWQLLSFSAKWLGGKHVTLGLDDFEGYTPGGDDASLVKEVWKYLDQADIVVAHNGRDFDIKKLNARFLIHGLKPPTPFKLVDTRLELKRLAGFSSNKLDWVCQQLELGHKLEHEGWPLWRGCMLGDKASWKKMKSYNRHDTLLLEKLYLLLAPWLNQPTAVLWDPAAKCPNPACNSPEVERRGFARNKTRAYQRFQCKKCGAWGRSVKAEPQPKAGIVRA